MFVIARRVYFFFFNDTATTEIYTLSLHDALPIYGQVRDLEEQLHIIRGETDELNRQLKGSTETLERERLKLARLAGDLTNIRGQYASSRQDASVTNIVEAELGSAYRSEERRVGKEC